MNQSYSLSSLNLQVLCDDPWIGRSVAAVFDNCFFVSRNDFLLGENHITLRFQNHTIPFLVPETARELSVFPSLRIAKDGSCYYLRGPTAVFKLDIGEGQGIGFLDNAFWDMEPKGRQELFMLSLLWLLRKHGLYGLHGNALEKDGSGIILVGSTCSGKSTITLGLIRAGWQYLSDDVTLLRQKHQRVEALALQKGFSVDPSLARHYPELEVPLRTSSANGHKRMIDLNSVYPGKHVPYCIPNILIFPSIIDQEQSQLIPLGNVAAVIELSRNCGGIFVDRDMVEVQMEVLRQLVYQTVSYQLLAGRDLYEEPQKISEILSAAVGT